MYLHIISYLWKLSQIEKKIEHYDFNIDHNVYGEVLARIEHYD